MSITTLFIIFLVLCMAVGPVFLMQPTRRQRQVAGFRAQAAQRGLSVRITGYEDRSVAAYEMPWPGNTGRKYNQSAFSLTRKPYEHGLHIAEFREVRPPQLRNGLEDAMGAFLAQLPESVVGVTVSSHGLALQWLEKGDLTEFDKLESLLKLGVNRLWPAMSQAKRVKVESTEA